MLKAGLGSVPPIFFPNSATVLLLIILGKEIQGPKSFFLSFCGGQNCEPGARRNI